MPQGVRVTDEGQTLQIVVEDRRSAIRYAIAASVPVGVLNAINTGVYAYFMWRIGQQSGVSVPLSPSPLMLMAISPLVLGGFVFWLANARTVVRLDHQTLSISYRLPPITWRRTIQRRPIRSVRPRLNQVIIRYGRRRRTLTIAAGRSRSVWLAARLREAMAVPAEVELGFRHGLAEFFGDCRHDIERLWLRIRILWRSLSR